ncbi:MAG: PLP-dependent aminotransferase family protein [Pseudomonadota bacterium]
MSAANAAWAPALSTEGPRYRALADAIAEAVESGALRPGDRLPPVRELAWKLQVTPGTVSRAYHLAETRGLLEGHVGRGTFIKAPDSLARFPLVAAEPPAPALLPSKREPAVSAPYDAGAGVIGADGALQAPLSPAPSPLGRGAEAREPRQAGVDFGMNFAIDVGQNQTITEAMTALIARHGALPMTSYHRYGEDQDERAAAAAWMAEGGLPEHPADTILCSGAQHGLLTALAATMGGVDAVALTEPLIHPGLKDCARALGVRLEPVAADPELGLEPEALDAAAARLRPGAIILTANHQNPTLATMSAARREAIAEIALRRRIPVIEDDVYGWLGPRPGLSFPNLIPGLSWYVTSFSKCVAAGLRAGFLLCPPGEGPRAARILQAHTQHVAWLVSALTAELIHSGAAARILEAVAKETAARAALARRVLGVAARAAGGRLTLSDQVAMAWLELPEAWRGGDFTDAARRAGVRILPAEAFAVGRAPAPHAVRVAFGACERVAIEPGLRRLGALLRSAPEPADHRA